MRPLLGFIWSPRYSGIVRGPLFTLVELSAMADKYQVEQLHALCIKAVRNGLRAENACELLACADRFRADALRLEALRKIFICAEEALRERPAVCPKLLEEILESGLVCIGRKKFLSILEGWGTGRKRKDSSAEADSLQPVISRKITQLQNGVYSEPWHSGDVLGDAWKDYEAIEHENKLPFLGVYVNMMLSPDNYLFLANNTGPLDRYARNEKAFRITKGWITWRVPYYSVYVTGFTFSSDVPAGVRFQLYGASDRAQWHLILDSEKVAIKCSQTVAVNCPVRELKAFRLQVLHGDFYNQFCIRGIVRQVTDVPLPQVV